MALVFGSGMIFSLLLLFPVMQQAIGFTIVLLILAGSVSVYLGLVGFFWYGFSLFLIYVGGLLVMFGYVVVLVPNFVFPWTNLFLIMVVGFVVGGVGFYKVNFVDVVADLGVSLYSDVNLMVMGGLGLVLFLALVCVVKICYFHSGSLRPFVA
uniref:NADH dehydrogenase subunit 6 n=1 Tax=Iwatanemertes piperata TaxID=1432319 RepID=W5RS88_9BILA|nr:NADH dehydrogenase subunit 6 [Iwatanemertes piperata]AHB53108.1 NADH dehydrogenase subunit 6 [Iwatanemertes piperata]